MTSFEYYIEQVEQFISALTDDIESGEGTIVTQTKLAVYREVLEHLEEIEQEPSNNSIKTELKGDMISRQAVCKIIDDIRDCISVEGYWALLERLKKLPPVNPQPKTGHWIEKDGFDGDTYYDCSECGESWTTIEGTPWNNGMKYCPNCGAKMVEPPERSNKE